MGKFKRKIGAKLAGLKPPFHLPYWKWVRLAILLFIDGLIVGACYWGAYVLRLDTATFPEYFAVFTKTLPWVVALHLAVYYTAGVYRQVWRFANIDCAILIAKCSIIAMGSFLILSNLVGLEKWPPRSVPVIALLLVSVFATAIKFSWRLWITFQQNAGQSSRENCFIYGAGSAGELLARHISASPSFPYTAIGFIDDDKNKASRVLHGLKIFGTGKDLPRLAQQYEVSTVLLALHAAPGRVVRDIVALCQAAGVKPLIMPDIGNSLGSDVVQPRNLDIKDLLRRSPKSTDINRVSKVFENTTVLVTGAGGSIGSEICHQIFGFRPNKIVMLDSSEFNLYRINKELSDRHDKAIELVPVLGSALNERLVRKVFRDHKPTVVLHAAAYKHVNLVEVNVIEGIINNVLSTRILTKTAAQFNVKHFLLVSTDKAVRPTSVMGATKRCCEVIVQAMHQKVDKSQQFCGVRFGNVLGSSGSVIPRFLEQIQAGGPVTVTDPEVTRFFMLISEAVGLVLQSIAMAKGGEIFVLNMGEPVKIYDMAKQLIHLAGKVPDQDIDIEFTGLLPGEKLYEELILEGREARTLHDDVFIATPHEIDGERSLEIIDELIASALNGDEEEAKKLLREIASEQPSFVKARSADDASSIDSNVH